jgi:hypothetical protein
MNFRVVADLWDHRLPSRSKTKSFVTFEGRLAMYQNKGIAVSIALGIFVACRRATLSVRNAKSNDG